MVAPLKYTPDMCAIAEQVLANGESLAAVCCELHITRPTLYEWRDNNPDFKKAIDSGLQSAQRVWEEIGKKGIKGEYKNFGGSPWMFTMKNRFRDDYAEAKEDKSDAKAIVEMLIDKLVE